jgi:hypothetical protein
MLMALAGQRYLLGSVHLIGAGQSGVPPHVSLLPRYSRTEPYAMRFVECWFPAPRCSSGLRWADAGADQFDRCAHHGRGGGE